MHDRAYILDLLSRGAGAADVARVVGCTASYVSQLQDQEDFARELAEKRAAHIAERNGRSKKVQEIHDKYLGIEEILLDKLSLQAKAGLLKPIEQMKLLQVVAGKKEPASILNDAPGAGTGNVLNVTNISLPAMIAAKFVMNERNQIIGTENGVSFAPMSGNALKELAAVEEKRNVLNTENRASVPTPQVTDTKEILSLFRAKSPEELHIAF